MGARARNSGILCADCNNSFSRGPSNIDAALALSYRQLLSRLWIFSGRREPPRQVRREVIVDGKAMALLPGGRLDSCESEFSKDSDSRFNLRVSRPKQAQDRLPNIEKQYGVKVGSLELEFWRKQTQYENTLTLIPNGIDSYRAIMKSAMNLLGVRRHKVAMSRQLDDARKFIAGSSATPLCAWDMHNPTVELHVPQHLIAISSKWEPGTLAARVCLFGCLWFTCILARPYAGPELQASLLQDPWDRKIAQPEGELIGGLDTGAVFAGDAYHKNCAMMPDSLRKLSDAIEVCRAWTESELRSGLKTDSVEAAVQWDDEREKALQDNAKLAPWKCQLRSES